MLFSGSVHHLPRNCENTQNIYLPRRTSDYVIKKGERGLGLYATGNISKGRAIFQNSLQYSLTDVEDGDHVMFYSASNLSIQKTRIGEKILSVLFFSPTFVAYIQNLTNIINNTTRIRNADLTKIGYKHTMSSPREYGCIPISYSPMAFLFIHKI